MRTLHSHLLIMLATAMMALVAASDSIGHDMALNVDTLRVIPIGEIAKETKGANIVFVGEKHDVMEHHKTQLAVIKSLKRSGAHVAIGLEMFKANQQWALDRWVNGRMSLEDFQKIYAEYWGLPWGLYKDIFMYARAERIPMIGLNVSKEITDKVAEKGFASLSKDEIRQLPTGVSCDVDESYMKYINKAYKAHGKSGKNFVSFCEAQLVWDKVMAWYVVDYIEKNPGATVVVLAGNSHAWKKGIPAQVSKQSDFTYKVVLPLMPDSTIEAVGSDYADFIVN